MDTGPPPFESAPAAEVDGDLPSYTSPRSPTGTRDRARSEHQFTLTDKTGKAWAVWTLLSDARSPAQMPLFIEGSTIAGSLKLHLDEPDGIEAIDITVSSFSIPQLSVVYES